jgi:nitroreductase
MTAGAGSAATAGWIDQLGASRAEPARDGSAPDGQSLAQILETATTVPDHGGLRPWRFALISGGGRDRFAEALVAGLHQLRGTDLPEAVVTKMRGKAYAAPCAVMIIASPRLESNVPEWEQVASASCTGYAMVLAATALGFGAVWKSAAVLGSDPVRALFGLAEGERLLGWVNLGSAGGPGRKKESDPEDTGIGGLVTVIGEDDRPFVG